MWERSRGIPWGMEVDKGQRIRSPMPCFRGWKKKEKENGTRGKSLRRQKKRCNITIGAKVKG